jgi:hypothetical protein
MITIKLDETPYEIDPKACDISYHLADRGIGFYEFWGTCYTDQRLYPKITELAIPTATNLDTGEEVSDLPTLTRLEEAALQDPKPWEEYLTLHPNH